MEYLSVSIIIPCRNEEKFIAKCLGSLINNNYPKKSLEILVYDGESADKTKEVVREYAKKYNFVKLRNNPRKFPAFALNLGVQESGGEIIIRCDAHSEYDKNYITKVVSWLKKDKSIGNIGGLWINKPANGTPKVKSIARVLEHSFCVGPNKYRIGAKMPQEVDTVPFGAWRRKIFNDIGLFNEKFLKAEDLELNTRIKKAGYRIILDPEIKIYYYPRENFINLFKMMFQYGYWKNLINKKFKIVSSLRQLVPPFFVIYLVSLLFLPFISLWFVAPLLLYLFFISLFSLSISIRGKDIRMIPFAIFAFFATHIGYGLGYLKGFWDIWIVRKKIFGKDEMEITR